MNEEIFSLERILTHWKKEYGTLRRSKKWGAEYYSIPISDRFELLKLLVSRIQAFEKPETFFTQSRKDEIVYSCIPHEKSVSPQSYKFFKKGTMDHLNMAIAAVYSKDAPTRKAVEEEAKSFTKEFDPDSIKEADELPFEDVDDEEWDKILGYKE